MPAQASSPRQGHYGVDAPYAVIGLAVGGIFCIAMAVGWSTAPIPVVWGPLWLGLYGLALLGAAGSFAYTTRRGKFVVWARLIAALNLRGDETILDMGCGRGLVLLEVARYLDRGRAVGIDLWRSRDQSGNHQAVTLANAHAEGVAGRVDLKTGDISALPFDDASFDLVVSSLAIHNIRSLDKQRDAVDEAVRILRPGGRLLIADFRRTRGYAERLRELGMANVKRENLGWRYWYGGPPWATFLVSAIKPADATP
jgi:SAM-dependent methyltransferase